MMKFAYIVLVIQEKYYLSLLLLMLAGTLNLAAQVVEQDTLPHNTPLANTTNQYSLSTGWADDATGIGYVTAPSVLVLTFISGVVNEWNAGYFGIPASALILTAPPLIFLGGRSVDISKDLVHSRAKLGWTLYALSIIPTSLALYSYTTDWGASVPLMITSAILGTASIAAMTSYAFGRAKTAHEMGNGAPSAWNFGLAPLTGGALAMVYYHF